MEPLGKIVDQEVRQAAQIAGKIYEDCHGRTITAEADAFLVNGESCVRVEAHFGILQNFTKEVSAKSVLSALASVLEETASNLRKRLV